MVNLATIGAEYVSAPTETRESRELWTAYRPYLYAAAAAAVRRYGLAVRVTDDADPYDSAAAMGEDIARGRFIVSRANASHPIFTRADVVAQRIGHDVLGHYESGAGFDAAGEVTACVAVLPRIPRRFWAVEVCETIGQTAEYVVAGGFQQQRAAILRESVPFLRRVAQ